MKRLRVFLPLVILLVIVAMIFVSSLSPEESFEPNGDGINVPKETVSSIDDGQISAPESLPKLNKPAYLHNFSGRKKNNIKENVHEEQFYDKLGINPAGPLTEEDLSSWNLIYVSRDAPLDHSFTVDLVEIDDGYLVDVRIHRELEAMISDAAKDGVTFSVCSSYRSASTQKALLDRRAHSMVISGLDTDIAYNKAGKYIANPGETEHHTGLAVDFITSGKYTLDESFADTDAFKWLSENAFIYGFILRYPKNKEDITGFSYEPWHYRYVGREHAASMTSSDMCLEEYLSTAIQ